MQSISPLRYPGGKYSIRKLLLEIISKNKPVENFIEPFAGGAGVSLWLLTNNYVDKIFLNDKDRLLYSFWLSVINNTEEFIKLIMTVDVTVDEWKKQKEIINDFDTTKYSQLELGFATFFVNRCNRSGILKKNVGPIGGVNQDGEWKIDARYKKEKLGDKIRHISGLQNRIHLCSMDAIDFMEEMDFNREKSFFYLDPPYFFQGESLYREYYKNGNHEDLMEYLTDNMERKWLVSYDDSSYIRKLYSKFNIIEVDVKHNAQAKKTAVELLIFPNSVNM